MTSPIDFSDLKARMDSAQRLQDIYYNNQPTQNSEQEPTQDSTKLDFSDLAKKIQDARDGSYVAADGSTQEYNPSPKPANIDINVTAPGVPQEFSFIQGLAKRYTENLVERYKIGHPELNQPKSKLPPDVKTLQQTFVNSIKSNGKAIVNDVWNSLKAANDLANTIQYNPGYLVHTMLQFGKETVQHPVNTGKSIAKGFIDPFVTYPIDVITNTTTDGEVTRQLTGDEADARVRSIAGNMIGLFVGGKVAKSVEDIFVGRKELLAGYDSFQDFLDKASITKLEQYKNTNYNLLGIRNFEKNISAGTAGGVAGGLSAGVVAGRNEDEKYHAMINYAIAAMPIGIAFEAIGGIKNSFMGQSNKVAQLTSGVEAAHISHIRQLQVSSSLPLVDNIANVFAINTATDLASAVIKSNIIKDYDFFSVKGIEPAKLPKIAGITKETYLRPDGLYDVLIGKVGEKNLLHPSDLEDFKRTGLAIGMSVDYQGKTYRVEKINPETGYLKITDGTNSHEPHRSDVSSLDNIDRTKFENKIYNNFLEYYRQQDADKPLNQTITEFMRSNRISKSKFNAFREFAETRLWETMKKDLDPVDIFTYNSMKDKLQDMRADDAKNINSLAHAKGMYVEQTGGQYTIRDASTGKLVQRINSMKNAKQFLTNIGAVRAREIINNASVPTLPVGELFINNHTVIRPAETAKPLYTPNGKTSAFFDFIRLSKYGRLITPARELFQSVDHLYGTELYEKVFVPTQEAFRVKHAKIQPWFKKLHDNVDVLIRDVPVNRREVISDYREAQSAEDIRSHGVVNRTMTRSELAFSKWLVDHQIDTGLVYKYNRWLELLERFKTPEERQAEAATQEAPEIASPTVNTPEKLSKYQERVKKLQEALAIDDDHLQAAALFRKAKLENPNQLSLYLSTSHAEAVMHNSPNRETFAKDNSMTPLEIKIANNIDTLYEELAKEFGIGSNRMLSAYMNHYRLYGVDEIPANIRKIVGLSDAPPSSALKMDKTAKFLSELIRSGDIDVYQRDPVAALVSYISAGFDKIYTNNAYRNAIKAIEEAHSRVLLQKTRGVIPKRAVSTANEVKELAEQYLKNLTGKSAGEDGIAQRGLDLILDAMHVNMDLDIKRDIVNTYLALTSSATLGFRPMLGLRDFAQFAAMYYTRFGGIRLANAFRETYAPGVREDLVRRGVITELDKSNTNSVPQALESAGVTPGLSPIRLTDPAELARERLTAKATQLRTKLEEFSDAGLRWGAQHSSYQHAHALAYMESSTRALKAFDKYLKGKQPNTAEFIASKQKVFKNLAMDTYDPTTINAFNNLIDRQKYSEAAHFLGQQTGAETVNVFGMANAPLEWSSALSRIFSQFGSWPVWYATFLQRTISRGSLATRLGAIVRAGVANAAIYQVGKTLGINMYAWFLQPAVYEEGGPIFDIMKNGVASAIGTDATRKQAQKEFLETVVPFYGGEVRNIFIPGSFAVGGAIHSIELMNKGYNPFAVAAEALGGHAGTEGRSRLDEMLGYYPEKEKRGE